MKVVIAQSELTQLISRAQSIASVKPAIPILSTILLEAIDDQLIVSASDLTVSIRCHSSAKVIEEGSIALPARRFFQLIRELTASQIKITSQEDQIAHITAGSSTFKINGMHKSEFPELPNLNGSTQVSFSGAKLKEMLVKSAFSAARDDSRFVLNGVLLKIANNSATFIGTDGKRLAKVHTSVELDPSFQGSYIIPLKAVEELTRMIEDVEDYAYLNVMHEKISIEYGSLTMYAKLLMGQYPDVEKVIPESPKAKLSLHREELMTLLRQVALFTSDMTSSVRFTFSEGALHLSATSQEIGEGNVSMPLDYAGEQIDIAFNPYYFLDILKHCKDETVQFAIKDAYNPGVVTDSTGALFVIMPMRLTEPATPPPITEDVSTDAVLT